MNKIRMKGRDEWGRAVCLIWLKSRTRGVLDRNRHSGPILLDELKLTAQMQHTDREKLKNKLMEVVQVKSVGLEERGPTYQGKHGSG